MKDSVNYILLSTSDEMSSWKYFEKLKNAIPFTYTLDSTDIGVGKWNRTAYSVNGKVAVMRWKNEIETTMKINNTKVFTQSEKQQLFYGINGYFH